MTTKRKRASRPTGKGVMRLARRARKKLVSSRKRPRTAVMTWKEEPRFSVVGIGASAGGLEALKHLIEHLPDNTGMAFVVVQHLDPKHSSLLSELLSRVTRMPVLEVTDGLKVVPNSVYVIPPNTRMAMMHNALRLLPRNDSTDQPMPIDFFFRSLAVDLKSQAVGVVLSGTASDGTHGLLAIKSAGGVTFAQDKKTAMYFGMPGSAIEAGAVDLVLAPEQIAAELVRVSRHFAPTIALDEVEEKTQSNSENDLGKIHVLLRAHSGVDFSHYKWTTINRRISRRMYLRRIETLAEYVNYLDNNPSEVQALYQDLLINVTGFFREPAAFEVLKKSVFPKILKEKPTRDLLRVWVPGCATGEEAYSIAIALLEFARAQAVRRPVQIFATDLSETAIRKARTGLFSESITSEVSPERLRRFFVKTEEGYQIQKPIRDMCIFARQDLAKDPPFSRMDLISCRNVLIYLGHVLQKRVIPMFHYALNPGGFLMLGGSESIGTFGGLFSVVDKKTRIYAKKGGAIQAASRFGVGLGGLNSKTGTLESASTQKSPRLDVQDEMERVILSRFSPPGVLVNSSYEIVRYQGQTGPFLQPAPGAPSLNILRMVREGLFLDMRSSLNQAKRLDAIVERKKIPVRTDNGTHLADIEIIPIRNAASAGDRHFLILFKESSTEEDNAPASLSGKEPGRSAKAGPSKEIERLRRELKITQDYLQTTIQDQEATNEELHSALEEIQSSNEELQSTNEEMETAKEELQSNNEELITVNEELQSRNAELSQVNNDLLNLLDNVSYAVVMIDKQYRIRRFTPAAGHALNLLVSDVGRPITDLRLSFDFPELQSMIDRVLTSLTTEEIEIQNHTGKWHTLRIRPYRTLENQIDGVVLSLVDVDIQKRALAQKADTEGILGAMEHIVHEPVVIMDADLTIIHVNQAFARLFHAASAELAGRDLLAVGAGRWEDSGLRERLEGLREPGGDFTEVLAELDVPDAGRRPFRISGRRIVRGENGLSLTMLVLKDAPRSVPDPPKGG